jgi:hypothetical protein
MHPGISEQTCYCAGTLLIVLLLAAMPAIVRLAPVLAVSSGL